MIEIIFWLSLFSLIYAFVGYPAIIALMAAVTGKAKSWSSDKLPSVSVVLSVYNEEEVIGHKLENFLNLSYPPELLELVVVSDGCSDRTEEIVEACSSDRIKLLRQLYRMGKTAALNRGVAEARGEIIIFTDANSMLDSNAVTMLAKHFSDPEIGLVSGRSIYLDPNTGREEVGGVYRRYEDFVISKESAVHSVVGADGAIYALRKSLYEPLAPEFINDFIHPVQTVLKGCRAVSEPGAVCREKVEDRENELRRQTRIMAQSWLIYFSQIESLIRGGRWLYAWQLTSHKLLRWLALPLMAVTYLTSGFLLLDSEVYFAAFAAQSMFMLVAFLGSQGEGRVAKVAYLFMLMHYAAVAGLYRYLSGSNYVTWNPRNS